MSLEFEWDEAKRLTNLEKHGVDLLAAAGMFEGRVLIQRDQRRDYGEDRFRAVGDVMGMVCVLVFTRRGNRIRLISAWRAGRDVKARYQARHAG